MAGFFDATCSCGRRFGWRGEPTDRPPCPACGRAVPEADLEADMQHMREMEALLLQRRRQRESQRRRGK